MVRRNSFQIDIYELGFKKTERERERPISRPRDSPHLPPVARLPPQPPERACVTFLPPPAARAPALPYLLSVRLSFRRSPLPLSIAHSTRPAARVPFLCGCCSLSFAVSCSLSLMPPPDCRSPTPPSGLCCSDAPHPPWTQPTPRTSATRTGSLQASATSDEAGFSIEDANKLGSLVLREEGILDKKRRWLIGSSMTSLSGDNPKRLKKPKFLTNVSLPESFVRSDEASYETVRNDVERSFGSLRYSPETYHVVQNSLQLFDMHNMNCYSLNTSNWLKLFLSIINNLNNHALCLVADIVTDNKIGIVKNRPRMKKIIKEYLPKFLRESNSGGSSTSIPKLSQVFRSPRSYREEQLKLITPVNPSLISSIHRTLEGLVDMPLHVLNAVNRKLRGVSVIPQFPPVHFGCNRELLIKRVKKRLHKIVLALEEGDDLPKPLSKALSVMLLSRKQKTRCPDILISEFFPFSPETIALQNEILKALWSLQKVKFEELEALKALVDPQSKVVRKTFRLVIRKYMLDCLFVCDEINAPAELQTILAFINRKSRWQPLMCSKERIDDVEAVLNVSSQFKQVLENFLLDNSADESEGLGTDHSGDCNDFELSTNSYCSYPGKNANQQINMSFMNYDAEATGDSRHLALSLLASNGNYKTHDAVSGRGIIVKEPKVEQSAKINADHPFPEESIEQYSQNTVEEAGSTRESKIQEICDETALISYRIIGNMLGKFLQMEGRDADAMTRCYLRGGPSLTADSQGSEDILHTPNEDTNSNILMQAVWKVLPSLPKRYIERVKELMEML